MKTFKVYRGKKLLGVYAGTNSEEAIKLYYVLSQDKDRGSDLRAVLTSWYIAEVCVFVEAKSKRAAAKKLQAISFPEGVAMPRSIYSDSSDPAFEFDRATAEDFGVFPSVVGLPGPGRRTK